VTFRELRERFVKAVIAGQRTAHDRPLMLERTGRRFEWDARPVASITDDEAVACLARLKDREIIDSGRPVGGPVAAFAVMSILREMFKWAKRHKLIRVNIFANLEVDGVRKPKRRKRFLTPAEIRQVWSALDTPQAYGMSHDAATAIRLIFATAARPGMVCGMLAGELVDLDAPQPASHLRVVGDSDHHDGPVWILPHERMKRDDRKYESEEPFIVPLNALAVRLVGTARGGRDGRVFGTPTLTGKSKMTPNKLAKCVRKLVAKLEMQRWTPHDARRTAATMLGAIDVPGRAKFADHEIGWLLAHREGKTSVSSTTEIYNRNVHFDEKRHMATLLGVELEKCIRSERVGLDRVRYARAA
jgi:integrase